MDADRLPCWVEIRNLALAWSQHYIRHIAICIQEIALVSKRRFPSQRLDREEERMVTFRAQSLICQGESGGPGTEIRDCLIRRVAGPVGPIPNWLGILLTSFASYWLLNELPLATPPSAPGPQRFSR
jgi:hypothetical protein